MENMYAWLSRAEAEIKLMTREDSGIFDSDSWHRKYLKTAS
jgi:hypothetical protein